MLQLFFPSPPGRAMSFMPPSYRHPVMVEERGGPFHKGGAQVSWQYDGQHRAESGIGEILNQSLSEVALAMMDRASSHVGVAEPYRLAQTKIAVPTAASAHIINANDTTRLRALTEPSC